MSMPGSPRSLPLLIGSVVAIALAWLLIAAIAAAPSPLPAAPVLAGCLTLMVAGVRVHLKVRLCAERFKLTWSEAALILAFVVVPAPWVVPSTPVAVGANYAQRRITPVKTLENAASYTAAAGTASGLLALAGVSRPFAGADLSVLVAAGAVAGLLTLLAAAAVVAVVRDVGSFAAWRASGSVLALTLVGKYPGLAASVLFLLRYHPRLIIALPFVGFLVHQGYARSI